MRLRGYEDHTDGSCTLYSVLCQLYSELQNLRTSELQNVLTLWSKNPNLLLLQGNALLLGNFCVPFLPRSPRIAECVRQHQGCR